MDKTKLREILSELELEVSQPNDAGWMIGNCPFAVISGHKTKVSKGKSLSVRASNKDASGFNCYVCGRHGNITELIATLAPLRKLPPIKVMALTWKAQEYEANLIAAHEFGGYELADRPEPINPAVLKGMYKPAWDVPEARRYLQRRLITEPTATLLGLLFSGSVGTHLEHERIMFPVRNRKGELYGFSGRSISENSTAKIQDMMGLKKEFALLGADRIVEGDRRPILLVEGLFAFASLYEVGADRYGYPIATLGATMSKWQAEAIIDWGLPVYCFYDNDTAGQKGIYGYTTESGRKVPGIRDRLSGHPVLVPPWPINPETGKPLTDPDQLESATVARMLEASKLLR